MPKSRGLLFWGAVCLAAALCAHAQKFQPKSIQFVGAPEYSTQELLDAAGLKPGTILNYADMNARSKQLMDTGMFASLAFKFDGQDLIFTLTPADGLLKARFDNISLGSDAELNETLHHQLPLYHGMVPAEGGLAESVRAALEQILAAHNVQATVAAVPTGDPTHPGPATIESFSITAPRVLVGPVVVRGASLEWIPKANDTAAKAASHPFDTSAAQNLEDTFRLFYQERGYAAVQVAAARSGSAIVQDDGIHVPFTVTINEGKIYKIGTVQLPAGTPITQPEVDRILAPRPGGQGDGVRLRSLWEAITDRYHRKGNLDCNVIATPAFDDAAGVVNYTVAIDPGPVYHLAFVKFENASDDLRAQLMHNWQMMPGDPFDSSYAASFVTNAQLHDPVLQRSLANVVARVRAMADQQTHDVNLVIRLEKQ